MNLISCDNCGIVIDKEKIPEPDMWQEDIYGEEEINANRAVWDGNDYIPIFPCPLCKEPIEYVQK